GVALAAALEQAAKAHQVLLQVGDRGVRIARLDGVGADKRGALRREPQRRRELLVLELRVEIEERIADGVQHLLLALEPRVAGTGLREAREEAPLAPGLCQLLRSRAHVGRGLSRVSAPPRAKVVRGQ